MKLKFHICYTEMHPKKLMESGFIILMNVTRLQISLVGNVLLNCFYVLLS